MRLRDFTLLTAAAPAPPMPVPAPPEPATPAPSRPPEAPHGRGNGAAAAGHGATIADGDLARRLERQELEIRLLQARIQHLEAVIETAQALLNTNQERLLRRLHDLPGELAGLTVQLETARRTLAAGEAGYGHG